jgi:sugar lactone lactonase YvrE
MDRAVLTTVARVSILVRSARKYKTVVAVLALSSAALAVAPTPALAADVTLSIFAGTGLNGDPTAGPALSSDYQGPGVTAFDSLGNLYVSDPNAHTITKITPSGTQSIFAGIPGSQGTPTPGAATSSHLRQPYGLGVDSANNVYIADVDNHRVEKVTPSGTLSVFAGTGSQGTITPGAALSTNMDSPSAIAVDRSDNVYVAVYGTYQVVKITPAGTLSIVAGSGSYGAPVPGPALSSPTKGSYGLAADRSGNVYVLDYDACVVSKVTPAGTLSNFVGTGTCAPEVPGPAASSPISYLYGQGDFDSRGNFYFADSGNHVVSKVSPDGTLSIVAGIQGSGGSITPGPALSTTLGQPQSVAVSAEGDLYVTDSLGAVVVKLDMPTLLSPPESGTAAPVHVNGDGTVTAVPVANSPTPATQITAPTSDGNGSWTLAPDGGIFTAGNATFHGSHGGSPMNAPAVGIAPSANDGGYYIVGGDGGVFAYGNAVFRGSMGGRPLNSPITGVASTCTYGGYYLVAGDGGVFAYGDAGFYGSMAGMPLNQPMRGIVDACGKHGYWTFAKDGGVFAYGDAQFYGSLGSNPPAGGVVGMVSAPDGLGYWLIGADGHLYGFGSVAN